MLEVKVYRHKIYKDIYLNFCGGHPSATRNLTYALGDFSMIDLSNWSKNYTLKFGLELHAEVDGYKGVLEKVVEAHLSDFEVVTLREVE